MRHQLEFDLANMSNEKRARKNALRRRVAGSPAPPSPPPAQSSSSADPPPPASETPGTAHDSSPPSATPAAELRRLASGRSSDGWDVVANAAPPDKQQQQQRKAEAFAGSRSRSSKAGGGRSGGRGEGTGGGGGGSGLTGTEGMEGVSVLRNHEWVMERVKLRKREESRLKREKYGSKRSAIWSPSMEQVLHCGTHDRVTVPVKEGRRGGGADVFFVLSFVHRSIRSSSS